MLNKKASPCIRALKTSAPKVDEGLMPPDTFKIFLICILAATWASVGLAGQTSGLIDDKPVAEIIETMVGEFHDITGQMGRLAAGKSF